MSPSLRSGRSRSRGVIRPGARIAAPPREPASALPVRQLRRATKRDSSSWCYAEPDRPPVGRTAAFPAERSAAVAAISPGPPGSLVQTRDTGAPPPPAARTTALVHCGRERPRRPMLTIASTIHATRAGRLPPTDRARRGPASRRSGTGGVSGARFSRQAIVPRSRRSVGSAYLLLLSIYLSI